MHSLDATNVVGSGECIFFTHPFLSREKN